MAGLVMGRDGYGANGGSFRCLECGVPPCGASRVAKLQTEAAQYKEIADSKVGLNG